MEEKKQATITVYHTIGSLTNKYERKVKVRPFVTATATVSCSVGRTFKGVEEFEPEKVFVTVSIPCYVEEVQSMMNPVAELAIRWREKIVHKLIERRTAGERVRDDG